MKKQLLVALFSFTLTQAQDQSTADSDQSDERALETLAVMMLSQDPEFVKKIEQLQADLPDYVKLSKTYRDCLYDADDKSEALACQQNSTEKAAKMGLQDEDVGDTFSNDLGQWSAAEKQQYLNALDKEIEEWEVALPCIQNAKNPVEIINCPGFAEAQ